VEHRPVLGAELRPVAVADVERACRLSRRVGVLALATATTVALTSGLLRGRRG
jgi:adenosylcobinamide-phosphate synthase